MDRPAPAAGIDARRRVALREQVLLAAALLALVLLLVERDWLWRWDQAAYDAVIRLDSQPVPDDLVIVAIDELSLAAIGRWPWPRGVHADLVERLTAQGAAAIGLDILFTEPDPNGAQGDEALAAAVRASGRVLLPVVMEQPRLGGQVLEQLPLPGLADAAAGIGHVHVELDRDGLARGTYLREGLGNPHWAALSVAMLELAGTRGLEPLPGARAPAARSPTDRLWVRDHRVLIPFVGSPGSIPRLSYAAVLAGEHLPDQFRDKLVLVGATVTGLGDIVPTPVSGLNVPMPGVEFHANVLQAVRQGATIEPLGTPARLLLGALFALAPVALYRRMRPRAALATACVLVVGLLGFSAAALLVGRVWFGPMPSLVALVLSYPIWSWLRLESALAYLDAELERLRDEQANLPTERPAGPAEAVEFLASMLPVDGYRVVGPSGEVRAASGEAADPGAAPIESGGWARSGQDLRTLVRSGDGWWRVGLRLAGGCEPDSGQQALLDTMLTRTRQETSAAPRSIEAVQARIEQVQVAGERLRTMRQVIDDTLAQMVDGVVLVGPLGQVRLANQEAVGQLTVGPGEDILGRPFLECVGALKPEGAARWPELVAEVYLARRAARFNARTGVGRDVLVQLAPLLDPGGRVAGMVGNFSDVTALREGERRRSELLGFLSHDLRSPLVSALAVVELSAGDDDGPALRTALERVGQHARTTLELAEQFVALARLEERGVVDEHDVDLIAVAYDAVDQVWAQAELKGIALESGIEPEEARVRGDAGLLQRVLVNLLTNAIKYSPAGARVGLDVTEAGDEFRCAVWDTGPGIEAADVPRLFERFERIAGAGNGGPRGAGLGLAFVKAAVERHRGRVDVYSEPGAGSRFTVFVPRGDSG